MKQNYKVKDMRKKNKNCYTKHD